MAPLGIQHHQRDSEHFGDAAFRDIRGRLKLTPVLSELLIFHVFWVPAYVPLGWCCQPCTDSCSLFGVAQGRLLLSAELDFSFSFSAPGVEV